MFEFYLNNTLVSDPVNWQDFTETIERDDIIFGLLPKYDVKLTFTGGGYNFLYTEYRTNGFCKLINLTVVYQCSQNAPKETVLNGTIFISECKFNLNKCEVTCDVLDDNYGAKIFNNKNVKGYLDAPLSKNGVTITPCATEDIQLFTPTTGVFGAVKQAYILKDAFRYIIDFMTDGTVGFESTFLDADVNIFGLSYLRLMAGSTIRSSDTTAPFLSFQELFTEVYKKYNIGFTVISVAGKPTIKIEDTDYFYNNSPSLTITDIEDLLLSINQEVLYSSVKFGGESKEFDGVLYDFPQTRFFSFAEEEYYLQTECNIDKLLDLKGNFIADSNIIELIYATDPTNDTYDKDVFFIENSAVNLAQFAPSPLGTGLPYYFNANLTNNKVAERFILAGNIALYLNSTGDEFWATKTSDAAVITSPVAVTVAVPYQSAPISFQDDSTPPNTNPNGNYDNTLFRYTSPASGVYTFEAYTHFGWLSDTTDLTCYFKYDVYDAGFGYQYSVISSGFFKIPPGGAAGFYDLISTDAVYIPATFYCDVSFYVVIGADDFNDHIGLLTLYTGAYWKTVAIQNGAGVYKAENLKQYFASKLEFARPLSNDEYKTLKLDLSKNLLVGTGPTPDKKGWIRKTIRNLATGETQWELISNLDNL